MFKKTISILMAIVFVLSLMPLGALADVTVESTPVTRTINFTKPAHSRNHTDHKNLHKDPVNYTGTASYMISYGNTWYAYVQLDLTGYEEIIDNKNTKLELCIKGMNNSYPVRKYEAYAVNDSIENYDDTTITYVSANNQGLHKFSDNALMIASDSNVTDVKESKKVVDAEALKSILSQGKDNSVVTLVFNGTDTANGRLVYTNPDCGLVVTYVPSEINNEEYVSTLLESVDTLKDLTGDDDITKTGLPKTYRGMNVTWESSDPDYVTSDGVITQHPEEKDVTLTATFSYKGIHETAETGIATKEFTVNVPAETPVEVKIPFTNYAYSRESKSGESLDVFTSGEHKAIATGGDYAAYTQFDLKGYEEILKNPQTSIQVQLKAGYSLGSHTLTDIRGILAYDKTDSYKWDEITYAEADKLGLHDIEGRPVLFTKNDGTIIKVTHDPVKIDANKEALVAALEENNTNSIVSVYLEGLTGTSYIRANNEGTCLIIKYYKSEIDEDAYYADIQSSFVWENITSDAQEALVNKLPTYYKGADIVWESEKKYVTSSGELAIPSGSAMADDVLKAHVTYKGNSFTTEEFEVTICDGSLELGEPSLSIDAGVASGSFTVTNATGEDISYILYLVVYNDGEMVNLIPKTINAVKGSITSETINANVATGNKVKFLVWKADGITPAIAAIDE